MSFFEDEISARVVRARESLAEAKATGDDYLAEVRIGELESLARTAADHELELPELQDLDISQR